MRYNFLESITDRFCDVSLLGIALIFLFNDQIHLPDVYWMSISIAGGLSLSLNFLAKYKLSRLIAKQAW